MISKNRLSQNYTLLCLYGFFQAFILAYVIERLYWEQRGMTVQLVVFAEIIYSVVSAVLEVPTGYLADRFSRKWTLVVGAAFGILELLILIYATTFWHFALAVSAAAVGGAATSGTKNALLYDSLKFLGQELSFEKKVGKIRFWDYTAHMLAALIGGVVATRYGYLSTYWLSLLSTVLAVLCTIALVEPPIRASEQKENDDKAYARQALAFLRSQPAIVYVLSYGIIIGACWVYVDEFWQLYAHGVGVPVILFGVISGINCLLTSLSGLVAYRLKGRVSYEVLLTAILGLVTAGVLVLSVLNSVWGLPFLLLAYGISGLIEPLVAGYLHHRAPSQYRATVESYQSLAHRVAVAVVGIGFGYISTHKGVHIGFGALGGLLLVFLVWHAIGVKRLSFDQVSHQETA